MRVRLSTTEKLAFFTNLANMLEAGIPLLDALETLSLESKGSLKVILVSLKDDVKEGKSISTSLARYPQTFDSVSISMLKAAETSGTLDQTLQDIITSIEKQLEFDERIQSALLYPLFVISIACIVLILLLLFVVPRIATVFSRLRVTIPPLTQHLFLLSTWLSTHLIEVTVGVIVSTLIVIFVYRKYQAVINNFFYALPVIRTVSQNIDLVRFCRLLSLLLVAGISIIESIELASQAVRTPRLKEAIARTSQALSNGQSLSYALGKESVFPLLLVRVIQAGEKSGKLDTSFEKLSKHFERLVNKKIKQLTVLLEPTLILFIGIIIGGMMLAVISPIYGLISQIAAN